MALKTNFTDDILAESMNGKRQYNVTENSNGTKSLEDVTDYQSVGSTFSAKDMNETNAAVNQAYDDMGDEFNKNTKYLAGEVKIHNNKLWKFKVDHDPGEWDESQVRETTLLGEIGELNENNAIETLSYTSNVSNYFMQFYKQGNHVWGNAFTKTTVFSDKTTIKFSADNFNGKKDGDLRIFCKFPGNIFSLNENVQHIIGIGSFRFENASTLYVYPIQVVAVYNGTDTEIRVPFTSVSNPADVRYEFIVDTIL